MADGVADTVCRPGVTPQTLAEVRRFVGVPLKLQRVSVEAFDSMLRIAYEAGSGAAMQMLEGLDDNTDLAHLAEDIPESSDLLESDDEAPIIRLINALLTQAVKENASDIHIEPYENRLVIRFRVDGVLREVLQTKRAVAPAGGFAHQGHVQARHRGAAPAAGRPNFAAHRRDAPSTCASPPCPRDTANAWCCACSTSRPGASNSPRSGWTRAPRS